MKKFFGFLGLIPAFLCADAGETQAASGGSIWQTVMMLVIAVVFFYFILWRPQHKRQKAMQKKRSAMQKGDEVTAMGIIGTIDTIKEQTVILKMIDGSKIEMLKAAINEVKQKTVEVKS